MALGDRLLHLLQARDRRSGARSCQLCGCTDRYACRGGCTWSTRYTCSNCVLSFAFHIDREEYPTMDDLFTNRPPTPAQADVLDRITEAMLATAAVIDELPSSRFRSLAMTKLEECSMWAKKGCVFT